MISDALESKYGKEWLIELESDNFYQEIFNECRFIIESDKKRNMIISDNIFDYAFTRQLFRIIIKEWESIFYFYFKYDKKHWREKGIYLNYVRGKIAHNNMHFLPESIKINSLKQFNDIIDITNEYKRKNKLEIAAI